jgi:hypothetical protein
MRFDIHFIVSGEWHGEVHAAEHDDAVRREFIASAAADADPPTG